MQTPFHIRVIPAGLKIVDANNKPMMFIYSSDDPRRRRETHELEPEEAREVAQICARALTTAFSAGDRRDDKERGSA